jgi:8-oxo-dGTP pyrophosphatase MutT (NUDIX family)
MSKNNSYGIVNIQFTEPLCEYNKYFKNMFSVINEEDKPINIFERNEQNKVLVTTPEQQRHYNDVETTVKNSMLFLLVSRKYSLGYLEFMRGRYDIEDFESISHLFKQMTDMEIYKIFSSEFASLWFEIWKRRTISKQAEEYDNSKHKFNTIMFGPMRVSLHNLRPSFPTAEWGFPKGRRNHNESEIKCAVRECCEETTLYDSEMNILRQISPLVEDMTGTNNVNYHHEYYISITDESHHLSLEYTYLREQFAEIDQIAWLRYDRITNVIRPYHVEKINIIKNLITFVTDEIYFNQVSMMSVI